MVEVYTCYLVSVYREKNGIFMHTTIGGAMTTIQNDVLDPITRRVR